VQPSAARVVPAVAVHGTILTTYLFGRRLLGERAAFRGALLLALTPALVGIGRLLVLDALLTFWVTLGLFTGYIAQQAHPRWRVGLEAVCAIACALGVLTKGPVAIVLIVAPLLLHRWLTTATIVIRPRTIAAFAAIIVVVNAPWYVAVSIARPEFGAYFFVKHNLLRFLQPFDHLEPIWYYVPVLLGGMMPGTLLVRGFLRWLLSGDPQAAHERTPALGFCLLAGGWCVLFFSLSGSKLPTYILPAFAPLTLALGYYWSQKFTRGAGWVCGCWAVMLLAVNAIAVPWYAEQRSPMGAPAAAVRELCADPATAVCCYPRSCDSAAFYLGRDDLRPTRSKFVHLLVADLLTRDRTVVLFTHNHSLAALKEALPPDLRVATEVSCRRKAPGPAFLSQLVGDTPWGLCDVAVIERTWPFSKAP
jgi:4-amino-4-deoxy-L-arabinose transferase-like glycosyltransferase